MAKIYDEGENWHLVISPNAKEVKRINEPSKGYSATLGEDEEGKHIVMDVHYDKSKYTLDNVTKFLEKSRTCPQCTALDKEKMNLESIDLQDSRSRDSGFKSNRMDMDIDSPPPQTARQVEQPIRSSGSPLKDIFANVFFDAYLTTPGKYFLGMMLNDDRILESAMPKDQSGIPVFMEEMVDFLAGKIDFVRSPDEVKDYLSVLKKDNDDKDKSSQYNNKKRRLRNNSQSVLIY